MGSSRYCKIVVLGLVAGVFLGLFLIGVVWQPARAEAAGQNQGGAGSRYSVVMTDGLHLVVTDNSSMTLYFYTIDDGEKPGAELKLRGTADLTQVGKPVIKPTLLKKN